MLPAVVLALSLFLCFPLNTFSQEAPPPAPTGGGAQSTLGIGINAIAAHTPQEEDLSDTGGAEDIDKFEIYLDWAWLRLGHNWTNAALNFQAYNQNWKTRLKKATTYAAYRFSSADGQSKWDLFMLGGLAYTDASFAISGVASHSSADLGYVTGIGTLYEMGGYSLGIEWMLISTQGEFDGIKIATGSSQLLTGIKFNF